MKAYRFDEDTVITTESLDEAKRWYCKDIGDYPTDITELNPKKDTIFYPADNSGQTLLPAHKAGIHQFAELCGDVYERITIEEAFARDGSPSGTYIIASTEC